MSKIALTMTAEDLLRLPDDGFRYELVRGEMRKKPLLTYEQGFVTTRFSWRLAEYVEAHRLGVVFASGTGFQLTADPDPVLAPNAAFVRRERLYQGEGTDGFWPGAPDLAVEVISPGDTYTEVEEKALEWLDAGCRMVLVLNSRRRTVTVHRSLSEITILSENHTLEGGDVVPGWKLPVKEIFWVEHPACAIIKGKLPCPWKGVTAE